MTTTRKFWNEIHDDDHLREWAEEDRAFDVAAAADKIVADERDRMIADSDLEWEHGL